MADTHFVVDVSVGNRDIGQHEIGNREAFDHLRDDEGSDIFIRSNWIVARLVDRGTESAVPKAIKVDFVGSFGARRDAGCLDAVRHDHEANRTWHDRSSPNGNSELLGLVLSLCRLAL